MILAPVPSKIGLRQNRARRVSKLRYEDDPAAVNKIRTCMPMPGIYWAIEISYKSECLKRSDAVETELPGRLPSEPCLQLFRMAFRGNTDERTKVVQRSPWPHHCGGACCMRRRCCHHCTDCQCATNAHRCFAKFPLHDRWSESDIFQSCILRRFQKSNVLQGAVRLRLVR